MKSIFIVVAQTLNSIAVVTGLTYNEINIIAYYMLLPFVYVALIDRIIHKHILKALYVAAWVLVLCVVRDFRAFSDALFDASVKFLLLFSRVGLDYVAASVVICVLVPLAVLAGLLLAAFPSLRRRFFSRGGKPGLP
jgi:hypothetical protein